MDNLDNRKNNKTLLWIGGGCLIIFLCILILIVSGTGGIMWLGLQTPENIDVSINTPINIDVGDTVELIVTITNTGTSSVELNSIDISLNYLNGFVVEETTPPFTETSQFDAWFVDETYQTFYFYQAIESGETLSIVFNAQAVLTGDFSGDIDVCIDSESNCKTSIARTIVR